MLQRLLALVAQRSAQGYGHLARQLGVSQELLEQMLQHLARMGYLRPIANGCEAHCAGCSLARTCSSGGTTHIWALTERGRQRCTTTSGP